MQDDEQFKQVSLTVKKEYIAKIKEGCELMLHVKFLGYHDDRWEGFCQALISYKYDASLFHLGQRVPVTKTMIHYPKEA